jgi:5-methyltetrahydrofolate--homocysteine methyltransferase
MRYHAPIMTHTTSQAPTLLQTLQQRTIVGDGAMGTQLMAAGMKSGECSERWVLDHADAVRDIHRRYLAAGCDAVTTNTFGGNRITLAGHALDEQVAAISAAAVKLAKEAIALTGKPAWVLGDIGPCGQFMEPLGELTRDQVVAAFREQAAALRQAGADAAIIETMTDVSELTAAIEAARAVDGASGGDWPIIATYAFDHGDGTTYRTMMGADVATSIQAAFDAGADVAGANCGSGMTLDDYRRLAQQMLAAAAGKPVILQANAGAPQLIDGKVHYNATPQMMAALALDLKKIGIAWIGGCCGTTPDHLAAMAAALKG